MGAAYPFCVCWPATSPCNIFSRLLLSAAAWTVARSVAPVNASEPQRPPVIARLLAAIAGYCARHPWLVCAATLVSVVFSIVYTVRNLTYETQRNDLHNKNTAYY